jgi:hypothetical protein
VRDLQISHKRSLNFVQIFLKLFDDLFGKKRRKEEIKKTTGKRVGRVWQTRP